MYHHAADKGETWFYQPGPAKWWIKSRWWWDQKEKIEGENTRFLLLSICVLIAGVSFEFINARHNVRSFNQANKEDVEDI